MTAAAIAPGKRAAKYNPATQRHSWTKEAEHHKRCDFCGLHVENREIIGVGRWFQVWDWPAERELEPGSNRHRGTVPKCPGPLAPAAEKPAGGAPSCSTCGEALLALAPLVFPGGGRGGLVPLAGKDAAGEFVALKVAGEWVVQAYERGRDFDPEMRRSRHRCTPYRFPCLGKSGACDQRGRLYPTGTFCDGCVPRR